MAEQISDLIQKIHEEGIKAAEDRARQIEADARAKAASIIEKAARDAEKILNEAKTQDSRMRQSTQTLLKQASRDMLLDLKKEIYAMLGRVIKSRVRETFNATELIKLIVALAKEASTAKGDIVISLAEEDLKRIKNSLIAELKDQMKKGITLKASDEISAGFIISYDAGKSHFDFTDTALAEYIASQVKPQLADILKAV